LELQCIHAFENAKIGKQILNPYLKIINADALKTISDSTKKETF
jgi:hypothetical protein